MNIQDNYVANAWENRFLISRNRRSSERFAFGFALGALATVAFFFWIDVFSAADLKFAF